jgi:hypothetical protein
MTFATLKILCICPSIIERSLCSTETRSAT